MVTSRAVAPLERLLGWSMPLVAPTGALVAMKGSSVAEEIETARSELERWGCTEPVVIELGAELGLSTTLALQVAWADPAPGILAACGIAEQADHRSSARAATAAHRNGGVRRDRVFHR